MSTGVWHHAAITFDIHGDKKVHLYLDGVEVTYDTQVAMVGSLSGTSTNPFKIGCDSYGSTDGRYWFDGVIDEVKVYNKSLDTDEVQRLYGSYN